MAIVGHGQRIVPVTMQRLLFLRGLHLHRDGSPVGVDELTDPNAMRAALVLLTAGWITGLVGILADAPPILTVGALLITSGTGTASITAIQGARRHGLRFAWSSKPVLADTDKD
jgi:hypothetical protein